MSGSRRLQRGLYLVFAYYAIFIGATSYRYDFKERLYKNSKWTQMVACLADLVIIAMTVGDFVWIYQETFNVDKATGETFRLDSTVNNLICLVRLVNRFPLERAIRDWNEDLRDLSVQISQHWRKVDRMDIARLRRIYLVKNLVFWIFLALLYAFTLVVCYYGEFLNDNDPVKHFLIPLNVFAVDGQDTVMHGHFLLNSRLCRLFMRLKARVRELVKRNLAKDAQELHELRLQQLRLTSILERITRAYSLVVVTNRLSLIADAALMGYYLSLLDDFPLSFKLLGVGFFAALSLDGYMHDLIVEWTMETQRETVSLLRKQFELHRPDEQLSRGCELFGLQVSCFPVKVRPFGMFACGTKTWMGNNACIFAWMVVLLQYRLAT